MAGSLSLAALRALSGRKRRAETQPWPARPIGQLLWVHATSAQRLAVLGDICAQLKSARGDLHVMASYDSERFHTRPDLPRGCDWLLALPRGGPQAARAFAGHWAPDVGLWTGGHLHPALIQAVAATGAPLVLLDADPSDFDVRRRGWFADPVRQALNRFAQIMANGPAAAAALLRIGLPAERIEVTGPLRIGPNPPPCADEEVAAVVGDLAGRPIWLAALLHRDEFDPVLSAHRAAMRLAHRLLLVMLPEKGADRPDLLTLLDEIGLRHAVWCPGDPIEDDLQVLVVVDADDLALWYRVSPQCFLGGSLIEGGGGCAPLDAAALGSAILYGPHVPRHLSAYARLTRVGAACQVRDAGALGGEVARLLAPDKAAAMALAGWEVVTEGAGLTDRLLGLLQDYLNAGEAADAPA